MNDKVIGILSCLFEDDNKISVYTDILKHLKTIRRLMVPNKEATSIRAPRKFAKYDWKVNHVLSYKIPARNNSKKIQR